MARRLSWWGSKAASVAMTTISEPLVLFEGILPARQDAILLEMLSHGHAGDGQLEASPEVRLGQRADCPAAEFFGAACGRKFPCRP